MGREGEQVCVRVKAASRTSAEDETLQEEEEEDEGPHAAFLSSRCSERLKSNPVWCLCRHLPGNVLMSQ